MNSLFYKGYKKPKMRLMQHW